MTASVTAPRPRPRHGGAFLLPGTSWRHIPDTPIHREGRRQRPHIACPSGNRVPKRAEKRGKQTPEKGWKTWQSKIPPPQIQRRTFPRQQTPRRSQQRRLSTSQNVTAPKHDVSDDGMVHRLSTSQNVTAPKPPSGRTRPWTRLSTSQNVTAPKLGMRDYA